MSKQPCSSHILSSRTLSERCKECLPTFTNLWSSRRSSLLFPFPLSHPFWPFLLLLEAFQGGVKTKHLSLSNPLPISHSSHNTYYYTLQDISPLLISFSSVISLIPAMSPILVASAIWLYNRMHFINGPVQLLPSNFPAQAKHRLLECRHPPSLS